MPYSVDDGATLQQGDGASVNPGYVDDGATLTRPASSEERRTLVRDADRSEWADSPDSPDGPVSNEMADSRDGYIYTHGRKALRKLGAKPYKFNPPLHPSLQSGESPYLTAHSSGDVKQVFDKESGRDGRKYRLGQLLADAVTGGYRDSEFRYGFRFLYNPTSISFSSPLNTTINSSAVSDGSGATLIAAGGSGTISMEILLNRVPDLSSDVSSYDVGETAVEITPEDLSDLRARGTMVDLDYLYRAINGLWSIPTNKIIADKARVEKEGRDTSKDGGDKKSGSETYDVSQTEQTGDIGYLFPTPSWLTIGKSMRYYGYVNSLTYTHILFTEDMIPTMTRVQISFQRVMRATREEFDALDSSAAQASFAQGNYFEPTARNAAAGGGGGGGSDRGGYASGYPDKQGKESNERYIWDSLLRFGFTPAGAAGILGNFQQESGSDPKADQNGNGVMDPGGGYGIAQWTDSGRQQGLRAYAKKQGGSYKDMEIQVGYLFKEMREGVGGFSISRYKKFDGRGDVVDATIYFHDTYESSADSAEYVAKGRGGFALQWYEKFKDVSPVISRDRGSTPNTRVASVQVVGDSLTTGNIKRYIKNRYKKIDVNVDITSGVGWTTARAMDAFDSESARRADLWVVALGTNDSDKDEFRRQVKRVMDKADGRPVRWINIRNSNSAQQTGNINGTLSNLAQEYSNLVVVDYYSLITSSGNLSNLTDGVHLNDAGYRWRSKLYLPS